MKFTHPVLVLTALELARREPTQDEVPPSLTVTMSELDRAGLAEYVMQRRGRVSRTRVRLTETGLARLRRARRMAQEVAAEDV
jgi:DNA-binding PadR family transcriptional regulator